MFYLSRLRRHAASRSILTETVLRPEQFVLPLFVTSGTNVRRPIPSLPGHYQLSVDQLGDEVASARALSVRAVLLFGIPAEKDQEGSCAWDADGPVPRAIAALRARVPDLLIIADVCLCEYTANGQCGILDERGAIDTRLTLPLLARTAVAYAHAGADVVAPSAMVDGQVMAIRAALSAANMDNVGILSYSSKFASAFYGPFREAVGSAGPATDRSSHQLPIGNRREAVREALQDESEGADMLMVKPGGPYLDVLAQIREQSKLPIAAYQVSGEYAMLKAASERGWLDERRAVLESLIAIRRAGADVIITYYAREAAEWLAADMNNERVKS